MADTDDQDEEAAVFLLENNPVAADPKPEEILARGEPLDVIFKGFGIGGQYQQLLFDDPLVGLVDPFEIIRRPAEEFDLVHR